MKVWTVSLFILIWIWYLYSAFPGRTILDSNLDFVANNFNAVANSSIILPIYRSYDVEIELNIPSSYYNHNIGTFNVEVGLFNNYEKQSLARGTASFLSSYQTYIVDTIRDFILFIPNYLGFFLSKEHLHKNIIKDFSTNWGTPIFINAVLNKPELHVYDCSLKFIEHPHAWSEIFLYIAFSLGFVSIILTSCVTNIRSLFSSTSIRR
jgi:hypothetical protein